MSKSSPSHSHSHAGSHHHSHSHSHNHGSGSLARIRLAFWLNLCFAVLELAGGLWTNSVAILSDAIHDFGDALAIGTALYMEKKSHRKSDLDYSYGYRRFSTASAALTALVLILGAIFVLVESVPRLLHPEPTKVNEMIAFALFGVLVNGFGAVRMSVGQSLNERVITWHLIEDLLGWVLVLIGALVMKFFDLPIIDALLGILLSLWVLWNVGKTLKEAMNIFLQGTPRNLRMQELQDFLKSFAGVIDVHHTHIWSMDGESHILTTHLVVANGILGVEAQDLKARIKADLKTKYQIVEATIEVEAAGALCFDPSHP